jgi:hypothetical protein
MYHESQLRHLRCFRCRFPSSFYAVSVSALDSEAYYLHKSMILCYMLSKIMQVLISVISLKVILV